MLLDSHDSIVLLLQHNTTQALTQRLEECYTDFDLKLAELKIISTLTETVVM